MTNYFDEVERGVRAAVRRRAHLPWYLRLRPRHRGALAIAIAAVVAAGPALAVAGVFTSGLQVSSASCSASGGSASARSGASCTFALSDGRRFLCPQALARSHPTVDDILHASSCRPLTAAASPPPGGTALARARDCLIVHGFRPRGGPAASSGDDGRGPDGELIIGDATRGAIAAFYPDARAAKLIEPTIRENARRSDQVQRHGNVTVVWIGSPMPELRTALWRCLSP